MRQDRAQRNERGDAAYRTTAWQRLRKRYLYANPWCLLCGAQATVADHYPLSRKALVSRGLPPDDPSRLRPLCVRCHNRATAQHQPGGWAAAKLRSTHGTHRNPAD